MASPDDPIPPPTDPTPEAKLTRNIREVCRRLVRGKAAAGNWQVRLNLVLRVASIVLSSLGSAGVIVDKVSGNLPGETGWTFWGSVVVLLFGILLQIANEFRIAQIAADSQLLAERCALYETQLEDMLVADDPSGAVAELFRKVTELFQNERYNPVLPRRTSRLEADADRWAEALTATNRPHWVLRPQPQRLPRTRGPKSSPPGP